MIKFFTALGLFFMVAPLIGVWRWVLNPMGYDAASVAIAGQASFWGGMALLCIAAGLVMLKRRKRYDTVDSSVFEKYDEEH